MELTLDEIRKQIRELSDKERVIRDKQSLEEKESRKKHYFDNVHGRVFINKTNPYNSGGGINILKVTGCTDFDSAYNSCDCIALDIEYNKENGIRMITYKKDTHRVDCLDTEATEHDFEAYRARLLEFVDESLGELFDGKI